MSNNIENRFCEGFSKVLTKAREEREKPKLLKKLIEEVVRYIDAYISEVFYNEFLSKPYRIYGWETINNVPRLKEQLLNEAWFQDLDRNDELFYDDEKKDFDYENIHSKLEKEYKLTIDLSLEFFFSYLKCYPQMRKEVVEFDVKESKSTKPIIKNICQAKLNRFINRKEE